MKRTQMRLLPLLILPLLFCGCWDYSELKSMTLVSCIGIDSADDGYRVTAEIATMKSSGEEVRDGASPVLLSASGSTVAETLKRLSAAADGPLYLNQCRLVVVGQALCERGLNPVMEYLVASPDFQINLQLAMAQDRTAEEILTTPPLSEQLLSDELVGALTAAEAKSGTLTTAAPYRLFRQPDGALPMVRLYRQGEHDTVAAGGVALLQDNRLSKTFSEEQAPFYLLASGQLKQALLTLQKPRAPFSFFVSRSEVRKGGGETPKLTIRLWGNALTEQSLNAQMIQPAVENHVAEQVEKAYREAFGQETDVTVSVTVLDSQLTP